MKGVIKVKQHDIEITKQDSDNVTFEPTCSPDNREQYMQNKKTMKTKQRKKRMIYFSNSSSSAE